MNKSLCDKVNLLSSKDARNYYINLYAILNDRDSSFKYGINKEDYASLPKEKVELVEEKLYKEMFEKTNKKKSN